jgi:NADP-dependent 3-hydroxy acid dehydrogenase YdfG
MKDFGGRVAVITGAGSGIGRALALALARRGAHLALADLDEKGLVETVTRLTGIHAPGLHCTSQPLDVADHHAMDRFAEAVVREHGAVHLVFNNAGVALTGEVADLDYGDMHWLMNVNFWGVVHGCKAFLPHLLAADAGHIVNTASVFGLISVPGQSLYNASKFAVKGFSDALHQELLGTPVRVSCVLPGGVKTNIARASRYVARDNQAPTREELAARFEQIARLTPEAAAEEILRGVERDRVRILVGRDARRISTLVRLLPVRYMALLRWLMQSHASRQPAAPCRLDRGQGTRST